MAFDASWALKDQITNDRAIIGDGAAIGGKAENDALNTIIDPGITGPSDIGSRTRSIR